MKTGIGIRIGIRAAKTVIVCAGITLAACGSLQGSSPSAIRFASYGDYYASKPDFARVEHEFPLTSAHLAELTPEMLVAYDQEQIDQIYARLAAGVIPDGLFEVRAFSPKGVPDDRIITQTGIIGEFPGLANASTTSLLRKYLWDRKMFRRDAQVVFTRVDDLTPFEHLLGPYPVAVPSITVEGREQWLMFPARLYCGQSLLDSRRESIIVDYSFSDDIPGYPELLDQRVGRRGLQVRDEIRMIRPGFYLGRAYLGKVFFLNFTLYNRSLDQRHGPEFFGGESTRQDCWPGEQVRPIVFRSEN
ncbi:hypothetical protein SAMN05216412_102369 [Nitrosospira multiformis]|uniref:Uncharacterized protein n=1 Tax=Nitrosospira multiformis TaxID=1231 RepID=A0A1I0ARZ2_9PROT|nr:hypothetical protein [Nitrosospira multiformis]SES97116.1 hypothetical protein SAMN05216412_102369 [Nitrosospira multiformis]